jgi:2OG-Fe(II) oxygenase superfamily
MTGKFSFAILFLVGGSDPTTVLSFSPTTPWASTSISTSISTSTSTSTASPPSKLLLDTASGSFSTVRCDAFGQPRDICVEKINGAPPMFVLRNFVSELECQTLMWSACNAPKNLLNYNQESNRQGSQVSWMPHDDAISKSLARAAANLLLHDQGTNNLHEELQVVRYSPQGHFQLHHDEHDRVLTVLYYLNGVAGTWFPLASPIPMQDHLQPQNKEEALHCVHGMIPGSHGLLVGSSIPDAHNSNSATVPIHAGDALVFYSYKDNTDSFNQNMIQDWQSIHAGLPAQEEKWIATHWFHQKT